MATVRTHQQSCNGGEMSPEMYGRAGDPKYQSGLAKCRNFLIDPRGPAVNRPGFAYVNHAKYANKKCRLIPFTFSTTQSMVLEFGDKYLRFHTEGQTLVNNDGTPYEVETPYSADDIFNLHYVQSGDILTLVHPYYSPRELQRYSALDWRLVEINFQSKLASPGAPTVTQHINSEVTNKTDYTREYCVTALKADGTGESTKSSSTSISCNPYGSGAYNTISWKAVSGAERYRVYRNQGGIWCYIGETESTSIRDENIDPDASITPPIYDDPFSQSKGISEVTITNAGSGYAMKTGCLAKTKLARMVAYVSATYTTPVPEGSSGSARWPDPTPLVELNLIDAVGTGSGGKVYLHEKSRSTSYTYIEPTDSREEKYVYTTYVDYDYILIESPGQNYGSPRLTLKPKHNSGCTVYGKNNYGKSVYNPELNLNTTDLSPVVTVTDKTGSGAELVAVANEAGQIASIQIKTPGQNYTSPKITIKQSGGSGATATATVGKAGDFPGAVTYFEQRRWFGGTHNRPNNIWATRSGTESDMSYSLPSQSDDRIAVRVAAREANRIQHLVPLQQLMLLTGSAEWRVSPLNSDAITPESMSVRPQSYIGCNDVQPVVVNNTCVYAAARGGHLRECGYSYEAGGFITNDICLRANHLFDNLNIVDIAYAKAPLPIIWSVSSSGKIIALTYVPEQQVGAFSAIETQGTFESCAIVSEGNEDILYAVVLRNINGKEQRFVERMHEQQFSEIEECVHLDCSGTYRGIAKSEISGLSWLEGMSVSILADGSVEPSQIVKDGKITLKQAASVVHIGLPYTADLQTLPVALALQDGSYGSGHMKNVQKVSVRLVNSSGLAAGPSFDKLTEYPARGTEFAGDAPSPVTGETTTQINPRWGAGGQICIRQQYPLPLKIVSITTQMEIA